MNFTKLFRWHRPSKAEIAEANLLADLARGKPPTNYTAMDRYRDFNRVFTGSDEGKRVLNEILRMAHVFQTSMRPDVNRTVFLEGERNLGLKILVVMTEEPRPKPAATQKGQRT